MTSDDSDPQDRVVDFRFNPESGEEVLLVRGSLDDTDFDMVGAVPIAELEQLADEWDKSAYGAERPERYDVSEISGLLTAKEELRAVIEDYE